ncbi:hypothetical protein D6C91_04879 [Aureobasidium pullulans]|uniref:Uncharacterized protein n=1 Tax=Aureobasidium pullulans TaxID=5580 RepID=A0A4V6THJ2_AURPU|nr:hypothetical protein D6C91_04879 [Aureobasidium pullulans]
MSDINVRTKSWAAQAKINVDGANEIARLLGCTSLKFKKGQEAGTFEAVEEEEENDDSMDTTEDIVGKLALPVDDEYEWMRSGSVLAREQLGDAAMQSDDDDDNLDGEDQLDKIEINTKGARRGYKGKGKERQVLSSIEEDDDYDDELLATPQAPKHLHRNPPKTSIATRKRLVSMKEAAIITVSSREHRVVKILERRKSAGRPRADGLIKYKYTVETVGGEEMLVSEDVFVRAEAKAMLAKYVEEYVE